MENCLDSRLLQHIDVLIPIITYIFILHAYVNPCTAGGRISTPLRFFADSEKTAARSASKFAIAVQPTI